MVSDSRSYFFRTSSAKALSVAGTLPTTNGLQAGAFVTANVSITIPSDMQGGQYYIFVIINNDRSLAEKKYDIAGVSVATGFKSLSAFSPQFKALYGLTPSEWLKNSADSDHTKGL